MDINFIALNIALLVPILILFFQNKDKVSEIYLLNLTKLNFAFKIIPISIFTFFSLNYFDILDFPSTISPIFIGKQYLAELLLLVINLFVFSLILNVYYNFYNFLKLSFENKIKKVFYYTHDKNINNRIISKWENQCKKIEELNNQSDVNFLDNCYYKRVFSKRKLGKVVNKVFIPFNQSKLHIEISPGTEIRQEGNNLYRYSNGKKPFVPIIIKTTDNNELIILEITKYLINSILKQLNNKSYTNAHDCLYLLKTIFDKVTDCEYEFLYTRDLYRELNFLMKIIMNSEDTIIVDYTKDFSELILIRSANSKFIEPLNYALNIVLTNNCIEIKSNEIINRGIVFILSSLLNKSFTNPEIRETEKRTIIIKRFLEYFENSEKKEKELILKEFSVNSHSFILDSYFLFFTSYINNVDIRITDEDLIESINLIKNDSFISNSVYNYLDSKVSI